MEVGSGRTEEITGRQGWKMLREENRIFEQGRYVIRKEGCHLNTASRAAKTARRIILMFQLYRQNIDPENVVFLEYVSNHLNKRKANPDSISYPELYVHVHNAIREFLTEHNLGRDARRKQT